MDANKVFNLPTLASDMANQHKNDVASVRMAKCTKSCFISMKENTLLPTEEGCLRNCFIKSHQFEKYFEQELNYNMRNL